MSRPSTSFLLTYSEDVDARHKAGHDELCQQAYSIGSILSDALRIE
jgi:hypothetical protein